jgi:hypothetical protein
LALSISLLSTLHRAFITLTALHLGQGPRKVVLAKNQVTEADLSEYYEHWQRLHVVQQAKQARYEPRVTVASPEGVAVPDDARFAST